MNKQKIKISIRNLVEFILRKGNIDSGFFSGNRALEGTRIHKKVQKAEGEDYTAEYLIKHSIEYDDFTLVVEGRADGILKTDDYVLIDEIKSTAAPLEIIDEDFNPLHWAQAKCYAYIYAKDNEITSLDVRLTYYQIDTDEIKYIKKTFSFEELEAFFKDLIDKYYIWAKMSSDWTILRTESVKSIGFPFSQYRKGQRNLAVASYNTIINKKKLFAQAPTGIGKTISTLFPAVKALGEGHTSKIFYLTAKTITRSVAEESISLMNKTGLRIKAVTITAKEKLCFKDEAICTPDTCEYAKGHYDRINAAIYDALKNEDNLSRESIEAYAKKHVVCPFEFTLDLTLFADIIICDYNYVFDPRVYLKRFFQEKNNDYVFLVDEAHNLVDRSREMFSATLSKSRFFELNKLFKGKKLKINKILNKINKAFIEYKKLAEERNSYITKEIDKAFPLLLQQFIAEGEEYLIKNRGTKEYDEILPIYFEASTFIKIWEIYDEKFTTYIEKTYDDVIIKLFCLDPSKLLKECFKRGKASILFSATLLPMDYFKYILGGDEDDYTIYLSSPFPTENRQIMIADRVSTKYKDRENSYTDIADYINIVTNSKTGNYMAFFPSYQYMNAVYDNFIDNYPEVDVHVQANSMTEEEREEFLQLFVEAPQKTVIGFCVLGGIFSEGIDLKYDRLIGSIVIGVGLPQICLERDIIKSHFDNESNLGFEYAYVFPGMNKVLQAAGRVIRSEKDTGIILLIDERFTFARHQALFPKEWFPFERVDKKSLKIKTKRFWENF